MSNLKLPKPAHAVHVEQKKDTMAKNVSNHMESGKESKVNLKKNIKATGGKSKK